MWYVLIHVYSVWCHHNTVNFLPNPSNWCPTSHPKGKVWVSFCDFAFCFCFLFVMLPSLQCCMRHHVISDCVMMTWDFNFSWEYTLRTDVKSNPLATPFRKFFLTPNTFINIHCVDKALILKKIRSKSCPTTFTFHCLHLSVNVMNLPVFCH